MATPSSAAGKPPATTGLEFSVAAALKEMQLTESFKKFVVDNRALWSTFGTMDSHAYRKKLMNLMSVAKLTREQRLVVHFLFSVVKKKSRVMEGLNGLADSVKSMSWYDPVRSFIAGTIVDYNTAAKSPDKFPGTHIPTANPGLDLLMWKLQSEKEHRTIENFFSRTTSVQLNLNTEMQNMSLVGYKDYWDNVVKGTRNEVKTEEAKFREEYYKTSAGDTYNLIDGNLRELPPSDPKIGYTREEIERWISTEV